MKKILIFIPIIFCTLLLYASTVVWRLYTSNKKINIHLVKSTWTSTVDGEEIIFGKEDGDGHFSNGIIFSYYPDCFSLNGMTACPDEPTEMNIFIKGKKINKIRLVYKNQKIYFVDKRGIYYLRKL